MSSWARQIHIKNPAELQVMREAGRINASVLATVKELLKPGVSTADLNAAAEDVLKKHKCVSPFKGYGRPPFPASITVSINRELVHGIPVKNWKLVIWLRFARLNGFRVHRYRNSYRCKKLGREARESSFY